MYQDNEPIKRAIWKLPGMEDYLDYYIDTNGNVWSTKRNKVKILNTSWRKGPARYRVVCLADKYKRHKTFLVHRIVALAFLPHEEYSKKTITHLNGIEFDNRLENLAWGCSKKERKKKEKTFWLTQKTFDRINRVVVAANKKGLPAATSNEFLDRIINTSVDEFIKQYGLHKIMDL